MKYGAKEVLDLYVFDENGKFITKLDSLKESAIYLYEYEDGLRARLIAKDALLDIELLKFIQNTKEKNLTDFDRYLKLNEMHTITFNAKNTYKKCKLIAKSIIRRVESDTDDIYMYEIPDANIVNTFNSKQTGYEPSVYDLKVEIQPFNEAEDLFKMHLYR